MTLKSAVWVVLAACVAVVGCQPAQQAEFGDTLDSLDEDAAISYHNAVQEFVRECMADAGFEYLELPYPAVPNAGQSFADFVRPFELTVEQAQSDGYGLTSSLKRVADSLAADPNAQVIEGLNEDQRLQYYEARFGGAGGTGGDANGCEAQAQSEVMGGFGIVLTGILGQLDQMYQAMYSDQRVLDAQSTWVDCMSESGFTFGSFLEPRQDVGARLAAIGSPSSPNLDTDSLAALRREELEVASVDATCLDLVRIDIREVAREYEAEFAKSNRELLDDFAAATSGSS